MSKFPTLIFRRFRNTSTENYKCILHSLASSLFLINIYIFRSFMNTSTENYKCILHSLASLFLSPTHLYLQEVYEYENVSLLHIYIFRRFMNTSTENFRRILHSFASSSSPLHIYFFSRVGNLLIRSSLICSDCSFAHLLRLLKLNE